MSHTIAVGVALAVALLATTTASQAQSVRLLGDFSDWSSYAATESTGEVCFALTRPESVEPSPEGYTQGYLYVTHRPGDNVRNEVNLVAGFDFAPESTATISVGGSSYAFFTQADAAWLDDPAQSDALASSIRAGSSLVFEGTTAGGIRVAQTFSLSGATASSQAINDECE